MSFDAFIQSAWRAHADDTAAVATQLSESLALLQTAEQVPAYVRLVVHVYGEHLGQWAAGSALLAQIEALPLLGHGLAEQALRRGQASLAFCAGNESALQVLNAADRVAALATSATALAGRERLGEGMAALRAACAEAEQVLAAHDDAWRALAVAGNNLALQLEQTAGRTPEQTAAMLAAAETGLACWCRAGTWLEEERAEYRLARSLLQAELPEAASQHAQRCLDICLAHAAPYFEQFFANAVLALAARAAGDAAAFSAHRAQALACHAQLSADDLRWCVAELAELGQA
ncbi:hypothetical protein [Chitinimonas taiwanensis]|uniref:Uncharacterized protein n=1 Tax=Chitinimonas taiwanensis DSM 18899 TaxID=1121279 RepID=A0A1K2HNS0_9NEIS|nr:hypothetical protein [Chitinimonas taiwanensis]SFZ78395.1 hypothetical protein SAMN02745887_02958 [Chitinimonas taiwanensis DSM 18899]